MLAPVLSKAIDMKTVATFFFVFLTVASFTSFGQTDSTQIAQPYGELGWATTSLYVNDDGELAITITDTSFDMEVVFVSHKKGKKEVTVSNIAADTEDDDQVTDYEYSLGDGEMNDVYIKTPSGVTSLNVVKEGKKYYATLNGKLALLFDDKKEYVVNKPADFFKNKVAWAYTPTVED